MTDREPTEGPLPHRVPIEDCIDLHFFPPRDILSVVGEYLEEAARKGYREVRLIHGKGKGAQRAAVRALLVRHPLVAGFSDAPPDAGGWGATRVTLRAGATFSERSRSG